MLYPVIDIGSNTVKLAVLDEEQIFSQVPVFFKATPLGLRSKVVSSRLPEDAIEELCKLLTSYRDTAKRLTRNPPIAFATASLRGLENVEEVLDRIREETGLSVELISGETEALYSFLGAKGSFPVKAGISVDLGGGSTEILAFRKNNVVASVSLPFGCLTLYQKFFDGGKSDFEGCCQMIREHLEKGAPSLPGSSILLSGGSAKAVLKYKNVIENKKGATLGTHQLRRIRHHFEKGNPKERDAIEAILKDRFRLIPPAVAVFSQIASFYGKEQFFVCRCGVREGCLVHHLKKDEKK